MFKIDKCCRFGSSCAYMHPDRSRKGNKKIGKEMKVELEDIEKATKKVIDQLKTIAQYISENMLTLETELAHSKEDPVYEVIEKVKHTANKKI